jgi:hypothetical protein
MAFEGGYYEGSEIGALSSVIREGDNVLEIGATGRSLWGRGAA